MSNYTQHYDDKNFWSKSKQVVKKAGRKVVETALTLFYCMQDRDTPYWAKAVIAGMLGYFISPIDAIPDILGPIGYTDDLGVFMAAMGTIGVYIKPEHKNVAKNKCAEWF